MNYAPLALVLGNWDVMQERITARPPRRKASHTRRRALVAVLAMLGATATAGVIGSAWLVRHVAARQIAQDTLN